MQRTATILTVNLSHRSAEDWRSLQRALARQDAPEVPAAAFSPCGLALETRFEIDPAALERLLVAFGAHSGWLERPSGIAVFENGGLPTPAGEYDPVIAGDLAGNGEGLSIRRAADGWLLTRSSEREDGDCLRQDVDYEGVDCIPNGARPFGVTVRYRIYWRHAADAGWRHWAARLLGFAPEPRERTPGPGDAP